mgnify:CR=1 FL=1
MVIPAGTYDGCDEDITTFAQYTALCARADVPEETVYNLVKTMMETPMLWKPCIRTPPAPVRSAASKAP